MGKPDDDLHRELLYREPGEPELRKTHQDVEVLLSTSLALLMLL